MKGSEIVNKVKGYRNMINKTQEEMATILGVHVNTYKSWEDNPSKFKIVEANKFLEEVKKYDPNVKFEDIFLD